MIEEPYRWVEAIANRREYIETQLSAGAPIIALGCAEGILFVTSGRTRQKVFEIYDRIALGAIGHPGDIERLRMAAIEVASTEGFTRSPADVSLRRLAHYSLSPVLKTAFEQVYGAPFLARLLFAEMGAAPADDLFLKMEYDGAISISGAMVTKAADNFAVIGGDARSTTMLEKFLRDEHDSGNAFGAALKVALRAISIPTGAPGENDEAAESVTIAADWQSLAAAAGVEAAVLERVNGRAVRYRTVSDAEIQTVLSG